MRHYVLTRSAYGPAWDIDANRRRLEISRAVTARSLASQTIANWTWIVLLDERDPFAAERETLYRHSAPQLIVLWRTPATDGPEMATIARSRAAAADYRAPWRSAVGPSDDRVLMTRLDDDDGLAVDTLARYQQAAQGVRSRRALMLPMGIRVWNGRYDIVPHRTNAMHTLVTPPGDDLCVYDYSHVKVNANAVVKKVDGRLGWLWVRHRDTISGWKQARRPLTDPIRGLFPIDWPALEAAWRA